MNENTGANYLTPWGIDETIIGLAGVGVVVASKHPDYVVGDLIQSSPTYPWKAYFKQDMTWCQKVSVQVAPRHPNTFSMDRSFLFSQICTCSHEVEKTSCTLSKPPISAAKLKR